MDHLGDELVETDGRRPAQALARLARVADKALDLGGPVVPGVDAQHDRPRLDRPLAVRRRGVVAAPAARGGEPAQVDGVDDAGLLRRAPLPAQPHADLSERQLDELAHAVLLAGGDHVVVGLVLLHHQVHGPHVVAGVAPVAQRIEVAEPELALEAEGDARHGARDLARHEGLAADRGSRG